MWNVAVWSPAGDPEDLLAALVVGDTQNKLLQNPRLAAPVKEDIKVADFEEALVAVVVSAAASEVTEGALVEGVASATMEEAVSVAVKDFRMGLRRPTRLVGLVDEEGMVEATKTDEMDMAGPETNVEVPAATKILSEDETEGTTTAIEETETETEILEKEIATGTETEIETETATATVMEEADETKNTDRGSDTMTMMGMTTPDNDEGIDTLHRMAVVRRTFHRLTVGWLGGYSTFLGAGLPFMGRVDDLPLSTFFRMHAMVRSHRTSTLRVFPCRRIGKNHQKVMLLRDLAYRVGSSRRFTSRSDAMSFLMIRGPRICLEDASVRRPERARELVTSGGIGILTSRRPPYIHVLIKTTPGSGQVG